MRTCGILITIAVAITFPIIFIGLSMIYHCNKSNQQKKALRSSKNNDRPIKKSDEYLSIFDEINYEENYESDL